MPLKSCFPLYYYKETFAIIGDTTNRMKIFITSDHHFFHGNIIKYCDRPFSSYQEMNEALINKWNSKVSPGDLVIHLGDFAFRGKAKEIRERLNGTIILIKGNHDRNVKAEDGFIIFEDRLIINNMILTHHPLHKEEIPNGFINIHGHIHQHYSYFGINVSVEKTNYAPIELEALK